LLQLVNPAGDGLGGHPLPIDTGLTTIHVYEYIPL
jgi:hypothetical protein